MKAKPQALPLLITLLMPLLAMSQQSQAAAPTIDYFDVRPTDDINEVTVTWKTTGAVNNLVYIYEDIGFQFAQCPEEPDERCNVSVRVDKPGLYRYTLQARGPGEESISKFREIYVEPLPRPTFPDDEYTTSVDMFNVQDQTIKWDNHPGDGYIQFRTLGNEFNNSNWEDYNTDEAVVILAADLTLGRNIYQARYCEDPGSGEDPYCSAITPIWKMVEPSRFDGDARIFASADENESLEISWNSSGGSEFWGLGAICQTPVFN